MRPLVGLVLALALVASPLGVRAQEGEGGAEPQAVGTQPTQSWLERMHPGAFEAPAKTSEPAFEIEYDPAQSQPHTEEGRRKGMSRGGKIAIAVMVPLVVAGVALGAAAGMVMSSWDD